MTSRGVDDIDDPAMLGHELYVDEVALPEHGGEVLHARVGNRATTDQSGTYVRIGTDYETQRFHSTGRRNGPRYGLTEEAFWKLLDSQDRRCLICGDEFTPAGPKMAIDHNHETGEVRGVLCAGCNFGLGIFKDSPDRLRAALKYLLERGCYGPHTTEEA